MLTPSAMVPSGRCLQHRKLPRPQRQFLLFMAAWGLGLLVTKRCDSFTLASTPKVIVGPGAIQFPKQHITATSKRPDGRGHARVGNGWPVFAYASLLVVSLHSISTAQNFSVPPKRCRRSVLCQRMGSFNLSLSSMAGHRLETLPSQEPNQATPWAGAQTLSAKVSTCSSFRLPHVDEIGGPPAQLLQSNVVPMPATAYHAHAASNAALSCARFVGHQRKQGQSARRRYQRTATRATRRQTGAKFQPRHPLPVLPVMYDPSRVRVQIQDVLVASSWTRSASSRGTKMTAANGEISQFKTRYISVNGFASMKC